MEIQTNKEIIQEFEEHMKDWFLGQIEALKQILSQSTPLRPEIRKAFEAGKCDCWREMDEQQDADDYLSNLKLDI